MKAIIILAFGLIWAGALQAQVGSSISADGTAPNVNAMLDVQSPITGDGKGILIPRVTGNQRTNANVSLAGGLLDNSGNLRGGAAQGLIVYQTDGGQGLYFNTSLTAAPVWVYLGDSTANYLPLTGGTMSGALNMGAQIVTNVAYIDFNGADVSVGRGANGSSSGTAVGYLAGGANSGTAIGPSANGSDNGAAVGYSANGYFAGVALGLLAIGTNYGVALGYQANGNNYGVAIGRNASGTDYGAAVGRSANGSSVGAAMGYQANGNNSGAALGRQANGSAYGAAVGYNANGFAGVALGEEADGSYNGAAMGYQAYGYLYGAALGRQAKGTNYGAALGRSANGANYGVALGYSANGANSNVAIGVNANMGAGGTNRIAIGYNVSNDSNDTARIRGTLHLDGGSSNIYYRTTFGSGGWSVKAFTIDHPLDPANKILRHFCMEGPQVWNVYAGNAQLVNGQAVVQLPDYYSTLNLVGSEIYSLTPIGGRADIWVQEEVLDNCFMIQGEKDIKVSWTIKVLRNDPDCREDLRRRPVEQRKRDILNGRTAEPQNKEY